ncbi:hypothetical protein EVAR_78233_1 [Eumeta japonica]|uniref:Uncharacterized protein n=1 Tax=Eumeta variegata TaxID=151549 RepID=A0A4C1T2W0_EUMVA|nr:hypothetical protein EVAR_78233_1 [Eumeta japonica]
MHIARGTSDIVQFPSRVVAPYCLLVLHANICISQRRLSARLVTVQHVGPKPEARCGSGPAQEGSAGKRHLDYMT